MFFEKKPSIIERKVAKKNNLGAMGMSLNMASPSRLINPKCLTGFMSGPKENIYRNWFVNYVPFHKLTLLSQAKNNKISQSYFHNRTFSSVIAGTKH